MLATANQTTPTSESEFQPRIGIALATHNKESIQKIRALRQRQFEAGELETNKVDLIYGQLMGMADELSLNLTKPIPVCFFIAFHSFGVQWMLILLIGYHGRAHPGLQICRLGNV